MSYFWLVPVVPGLSAAMMIIFGSKMSRRWISWQACLAIFFSLILSAVCFSKLTLAPDFLPLKVILFNWIAIETISISAAFELNHLAAFMALVVTTVSFAIHVYSTGYMKEERSYARYFGLLNLFTFFMLLLVYASSLVFMFIGWEGVGLCSYLLISFWFERDRAARAGIKAFLVNRIGDAGFLAGILFVLAAIGTTEFIQVNQAVSSGAITSSTAGLVGLLFFIGAMGKSAQLPLHIWLPDAMEGPTPVSALIHAATMVTAGVYLVIRLFPLFSASEVSLPVIASIGAATAVVAALSASSETDLKRLLAFSTISQLGYMFIGLGVGAAQASFFHLMTHAFFKSLLFLVAGVVIHTLAGEQDITRMGGLSRKLPLMGIAFGAGAAALAGLPFFSGFFSKDAILIKAFSGGHYVIWALGLSAAFLTSYYIFRAFILVFTGKPEWKKLYPSLEIHKVSPIMNWPVVFLAAGAVFSGFLGAPSWLTGKTSFIDHFLFSIASAYGHEASATTEIILSFSTTLLSVLGIFAVLFLYRWNIEFRLKIGRKIWPFTDLTSQNFYFDRIFDKGLAAGILRSSSFVQARVDIGMIDRTLDFSAEAAQQGGRALSSLQTGFVRDYLLAILLGIVIFLGVLIVLT